MGGVGIALPQEAMRDMAPFENFLLLVDKVPSSTASCPAQP